MGTIDADGPSWPSAAAGQVSSPILSARIEAEDCGGVLVDGTIPRAPRVHYRRPQPGPGDAGRPRRTVTDFLQTDDPHVMSDIFYAMALL